MTNNNRMDINSVSNIQQTLNNFAHTDWASQTNAIQQSLYNFARTDWASQISATQQSLNNFARTDWASQISATQQALNNLAHIDWASQTNAIQQSLNNFARIDWVSQISATQQALNNLAHIDWASQTNAIQQSLNNFARIDWVSPISATQQALNNFARIDWATYNQTFVSSLKQFDSINLANTFNLLNNFPVQEISEALEEYENTNKQKYTNSSSEITVNEKQHFSYEELINIIDSRLETTNSEKTGFKKFMQDLLLSYGQDTVKYFIGVIILPFFHMLFGIVIENHMLIINTIQESLSNGIYVIGYAHAKKVIKKEGLSRYENINLIGLIRINSYLRISPNRHSTPIHSEKLPLDTVINIIERKKNWVKVEANINEISIIGWIEESKIIKFKRKK
ncbi:hypothetical protein ACVNNN_07720 [Lysinibacillus fusiformis]|uniref:hypothetical protein n=1 Tax=Lysinibacillus sp. PWR01 TaxID=3342384 RepID=UPI00372D0452